MVWSQINHHSDEASAHSVKFPVNWYRHQVATSQTVAPQSFLAFLFSGGLNLQAEHHLFPAVNHIHLAALQPKIQMAAGRHGLHYPSSDNVFQAIWKLFSFLQIMGERPQPSPKDEMSPKSSRSTQLKAARWKTLSDRASLREL